MSGMLGCFRLGPGSARSNSESLGFNTHLWILDSELLRFVFGPWTFEPVFNSRGYGIVWTFETKLELLGK